MAKCVMVLYPDPVDGYPPQLRARQHPDDPRLSRRRTVPTPSKIDFTPGELLGCVSGALGLRKFFEEGGHELVVTSDKDGPDSEFERELPDADIVISQPFWPAYLTKERIAKAPKLKLALTAGIGSDHVDLDAAKEHGITVAEVTYSNSISVAEHAVMQILDAGAQLRAVASVGRRRWLEHRRLRRARLRPGGYGRRRDRRRPDRSGGTAPAGAVRRQPALHRHAPACTGGRAATECDVSPRRRVAGARRSTWCPSTHRCTTDTRAMFDEKLIASMRRGSYIVNTARAEETVPEAIAARAQTGQLAGYAGDVWYPAAAAARPPVADHAEQRDDATCFGHHAVRAGSLCRRHPGDPGVLLRGHAHPPRST